MCKIQRCFKKSQLQKAIHVRYFQFIFNPFVVFVNIRVYCVQCRSQVFWRSERVITAVAPKINVNVKKSLSFTDLLLFGSAIKNFKYFMTMN